jgi:hypothetical protein
LRQQHERLKLAWQGRRALVPGAAAADKENKGTRVKELERQLDDVRAAHTKKVRQLEARVLVCPLHPLGPGLVV